MQKSTSETHMRLEALQAVEVVQRQLCENAKQMIRLGLLLRSIKPKFVLTCARGSSDHAAQYLKYIFEANLGVVVSSVSPSVNTIYNEGSTIFNGRDSMKGMLFIAISQSGGSPDIVATAEAAAKAGATVVALVNEVNSPLAEISGHIVPLHAGKETSVAATKSYIASLSAILMIAAHWSGSSRLLKTLDSLPASLTEAKACDWSPALPVLAEAASLFVVSRGFSFGIALEAALKFKETCGLHAEGFSAAEVKHGPMALVSKGSTVLIFAPEDQVRETVENIAREFVNREAKVLFASSQELEGAINLPLAQASEPEVAPLLIIQSFYLMAEGLSRYLGFHPDQPQYLNKVTKTL